MKSKVYKVQYFVHVFRCEYLCKVETGKNLAINFYLTRNLSFIYGKLLHINWKLANFLWQRNLSVRATKEKLFLALYSLAPGKQASIKLHL